MTDSPLDMSNASLASPSHHLDNSQHSTDNNSNNSVFSSLPSLPSLPSIDLDLQSILQDTSTQPSSSKNTHNMNVSTLDELPSSSQLAQTTIEPSSPPSTSSDDKGTDDNGQRFPLRQIMWGHVRSCSALVVRLVFRDNNLPLALNVVGHLLVARQLWGKSHVSVTRYTNLQHPNGVPITISMTTTSRMLMADQFRSTGVLHLALALLAALALKERRLSTERTALWVLCMAAWCQSFVQTKAYLKTPALYTLKALQEWGALNGFLTLMTTIALRNTIRRTGRLV